MRDDSLTKTVSTPARTIRLGFLGVGWIGRHRMQAILDTGVAEAAAIADASPEVAEEARRLTDNAVVMDGLDAMLDQDLDGIVIATPSALHAEQAIAALERGVAVFCQKPLGRSCAEVAAVVEAARKADRLLGVDLSYRYTDGMTRIRDLIRSGELGQIFAADLVFHNAYGPDKAWFYNKSLSGGGCVMDLGVHLADLCLWALDFPDIARVEGQLFAQGAPLPAGSDTVEDFAAATVTLKTGAVLRLTCSWRLQAGCDAIIAASFYGTNGGAALKNLNGSFYDFVAERYHGTGTTTLAAPPDQWGGKAAADWAKRLAAGARFDPDNVHLVTVAGVLDDIYQIKKP